MMTDSEIYLAGLTDTKYPRTVMIEFTNRCNLKCNFCLNSKKNFRDRGDMTVELFEKIINEIDEHINIIICGIGEPTLHKNFIVYLNKLSSKFNNIYLITNGQFRSSLIPHIIDSNITKITISLDYFDSTEYMKNKKGNFNKVINNINLLIQSRPKTSNLSIQVNMLAEQFKEYQIQDAIIYFNKIFGDNDFIYTRNVKSLANQIKTNYMNKNINDWLFLKKLKEQLSLNIDVDKFGVENWVDFLKLKSPLFHRMPCRHPFLYTMILYDGRTTFCCIDFNGKMISGDLNLQSLHEIWNGFIYKNFRNDMLNLDLKKKLCLNCDEWYKQI